ncbi:hypothetical protein GCM10023115_03210 [Pontixanthobacter gangjinensis]|uniref:OmpA family protein n=1 Tax=Pontixanthobacter gangjinensis TaxID=1028742 RepID=A0A6I4SIX2_9SPHN|nr:OmpA family protein [Pontixanthobacter gangjinensis]MXO55575.1 OmpA family protein [Pontixanthobacter gangjinensis]
MIKPNFQPAIWALVAATALSLGACKDKSNGPGETPEPIATETAPTEQKSILSPDAAIRVEVAPLKPLQLRIPFDDGGSELGDQAVEVLKEALLSPQMKAGGAIILGGHTDSAGYDEANLRASERRAEAVREWLVENNTPATRISVIAFGERNPARPNANPDGTDNLENQAFNRRVMLDIALPAELAESAEAKEKPTLIEQVAADN